jgi:hypothetical protein
MAPLQALRFGRLYNSSVGALPPTLTELVISSPSFVHPLTVPIEYPHQPEACPGLVVSHDRSAVVVAEALLPAFFGAVLAWDF